ncbi:MAG: NAD(P)/FAD-dependent oxidoreductase [Flavobacteriales bacterium]
MFDTIVIGGGAAGFFGAINILEDKPAARVLILEKASKILQKVKVSGGGRCNVTHACFDPQELISFYPRGGKELLGPFSKFMTYDTVAWFAERNVELKTEEDNRMFPTSDNSQTIIDCFLKEVERKKIKLNTNCGVKSIRKVTNGWSVFLHNDDVIKTKTILMAAGSSPAVWEMLASVGHQIKPPIPSLFTFNVKDKRIDGLMGISVPSAEVSVMDSTLTESGPLLITHWGMSGPAILKLSAWGAGILHKQNYNFKIRINYIAHVEDMTLEFKKIRDKNPAKKLRNLTPFGLPQRLWLNIVNYLGIEEKNYGDLSKNETEKLINELSAGVYNVNGKSTFKDEFVTCGGVSLKEIDMRTMESKLHKGLHFAGEVMNIDAVTGGFNFQAAWTTSFIAAKAIGSKI